MIQEMRNWEAEQNRTPVEEMLNNSLQELEWGNRWEQWFHRVRKSCYNFRVTKIVKVLDGDTIDVLIDLGFDLYKKERVRIAGVDTPEKRTRDLEEKAVRN